MVQEVAAVVLELHQGGGGHADTTSRQHQAEAAAPERKRFVTKLQHTGGPYEEWSDTSGSHFCNVPASFWGKHAHLGCQIGNEEPLSCCFKIIAPKLSRVLSEVNFLEGGRL